MMELINKNDLEGTFEITDTLRAIGVSKSNLTPNEQGVAPLSNQSGMTEEKKASSLETGVITDKPIEVAATDSLESLDLSSIVPESKDTPAPTEEKKDETPVEEKKEEKIELPPSEPVQAQAPEVVPAGLFIDGTPDEEIKLVNPLEESTTTEEKKEEAPVEEPKKEEPAAEVKEETPTEEKKEEAPVEEKKEEAPVEEPKKEEPAVEVKEETPTEEKKEEAPVEEPKKEEPAPVEEKKEEKLEEEKDDFKFETAEDVEKYVNGLIDEMEKRHQEELDIFRTNVVKTCKFLFDNKSKEIVNKEEEKDEKEEMIDAIPSLDPPAKEEKETTEQEFANTMEIPVLNEIPSAGVEIPSVDNEEIKPKFVL